MITQAVDPLQYVQKARQIKIKVKTLLSQWGLIPKFKRWRLAQDPDTGMVVLFGVLDNKYIATQATTPFSDYFDPRLLHDLATELHVQVIPSATDGLRYAFILERGQIDIETAKISEALLNGDSLLMRVIHNNKPIAEGIKPQGAAASSSTAGSVDDQALVDKGVGAFLKVFDDIKLRDEASKAPSVQDLHDDILEKEKPGDNTNLHRRSGDEKIL